MNELLLQNKGPYIKLIENKGVDLMNMSPTLKDEYLGEMSQTYNEIYERIGDDLSEPGATIQRDDLFDLCSDRVHDEELSNAIVWWRSMTQEQRCFFINDMFPYEFYEVGDNSGFGPDGTMYP